MSYDILSTSGINSLVNSYITNESNKRILPLNNRVSKYNSISSAYSTILSKLDSFKSLLSTLKSTGTASVFQTKKATSSSTNFLSVAATSAAALSSYNIRVNQLAKSDLAMSQDLISSDASTVITSEGVHTFTIKTGDGSGGQFVSNVEAVFEAADFTGGVISNQDVMEKIRDAINTDKAVITSNELEGSTLSSGSFTLNLNGTETTINYDAGTYSDVIDNVISQINELTGVSAQKITNGLASGIEITVTDSSKYITIGGDTGSLISELGLAVDNEMGASGLVTASSFSPTTTLSQFSITAKKTGFNFKIEEISDDLGYSALSAIGINLGTSRTTFVQNEGSTDTAGFVYALADLNSKISFNGLSIERDSNIISDLVSGVTLNLTGKMADTDIDVNINIENDVDSVKAKVEEFITSFNDIYAYLKTNSTSTADLRGILLGDSSASSLLSIFSSTAYSPVTGLSTNDINTLSKLGITFNSTTGLSITSSSQLEDAINDTPEDVEALFNSTNGIAASLYDKISPYTGADGYLTSSQSLLDSSINYLNDSMESVQNSINKNAEILRSQYQQLQSQLASLLSSSGLFSGF